MITYSFTLGRKRLLSIAELISVIGKTGRIIDINEDSLLVSFDKPLSDPQDSLNRLGGTIKIAQVIAEIHKDNAIIAPTVSEHLTKKFSDSSQKLSYGISAHSFSEGREEIVKSTLKKVKSDLEAAGIKSRYINRDYNNLETAAIRGEKLIEKGSEMIVINGTHRNFICETVSVQDIEAYSHRDYDRPERDPKLGMLPPKLAQLMVNLGGKTVLEGSNSSATQVYDPFTGLGTVLMEALLLGNDVIGSDLEEEVINKAQINLDWLIKEENIHDKNIRLFACDATSLKPDDFPIKPSLVVTESYLGPPLKELPQKTVVKKNFSHIRELLYRFFRVIHEILPEETPVVISFLAYKQADHYLYLEGLVENVKQMGYKVDPLIPHSIMNKFEISGGEREGLIYDRENQVVAREIWRFVRK
ncbi:TRM11 family SAM-dependent methyltransferase [Pseudomonadota bacterium]